MQPQTTQPDAARTEARVDLRPLGIPDILDAAFVLYRAHFKTLIGITAVISIPLLVLSLLASAPALFVFSQTMRDTETAEALMPLLLGGNLASGGVGLVGAIASLVQFAALIVATGFFYVGASAGVGSAYKHVLSRLLSLIAANVLLFVIGGLLLALLFFAGVAAGIAIAPLETEGSPIVLVIAVSVMLAPILLGLALTLRFAFLTHTILLEGVGALHGFRRSWHLTSRSTLRVLAIFLLAGLLLYALQIVPLVFTVIPFLLAPEMLVLSSIVTSVINQVVSLVLSPIPIAIGTVVYFDLRVRREGYDLRRRADRMLAAANARAAAQVTAVASGPTIGPPAPAEPQP